MNAEPKRWTITYTDPTTGERLRDVADWDSPTHPDAVRKAKQLRRFMLEVRIVRTIVAVNKTSADV